MPERRCSSQMIHSEETKPLSLGRLRTMRGRVATPEGGGPAVKEWRRLVSRPLLSFAGGGGGRTSTGDIESKRATQTALNRGGQVEACMPVSESTRVSGWDEYGRACQVERRVSAFAGASVSHRGQRTGDPTKNILRLWWFVS